MGEKWGQPHACKIVVVGTVPVFPGGDKGRVGETRVRISASPHMKSPDSTKRIMRSVIIALLPAGIAGVYIFGIRALYVVAAASAAAVGSEFILQKLSRRPVSISDGSALITGVLLAYNLPPAMPIWMAATGAVFAIAIAKLAFGGLGRNIFNPALAGRAFLMASWPLYMTTWSNPRWWPDGVSSATPLVEIIPHPSSLIPRFSYLDLLIGNRGGCIGEVCAIALLAGAAFLLWRKCITLHTPLAFIGAVAVLTHLSGGDWIYAVLSGGLVLGAFFMATDMVTTPVTKKGAVAFGLGCGIITFAIRKWGGYPEGVSYSILLMNTAAPLIDRLTKPRVFGKKKQARRLFRRKETHEEII